MLLVVDAPDTGVTRISLYESGMQKPDPATIEVLAQLQELPVACFLAGYHNGIGNLGVVPTGRA